MSNLEIPVRYNGFKVGKVEEFNVDSGEMKISLDMNKNLAKLIKAMIIESIPIGMSCSVDDCN